MKRVLLPLMFAVVTMPVTIGAQTPAGAKPAPAAPTAKPAAAAPAQAGEARTIELVVKDDMKFDKPALTAKPGEKLRIVLKNMGAMPKMAAGHNFVLLKLGTDALKFANESVMAAPTYIPASMKDSVLASTPLTGPGETVEVTFTVPTTPGTYNFLCSFAGHFAQNMKGTLVVK